MCMWLVCFMFYVYGYVDGYVYGYVDGYVYGYVDGYVYKMFMLIFIFIFMFMWMGAYVYKCILYIVYCSMYLCIVL